MQTIKSKSHDYLVENFSDLPSALRSIPGRDRALYLVDWQFSNLYREVLFPEIPESRVVYVNADEEAKSFERLPNVFLEILKHQLKRDESLVVMGGGVLQDIGGFIATVLFRGLRWELLPTTLLAQADSCVGSKSSINIGPYKNQIGTFYPPQRILLTSGVLATLPWDEIRSGLGEVIKLQLLSSQEGFRELMSDLEVFRGDQQVLEKWVARSIAVKKPFIEADEFDRGVRNLLNYGHTFGHAYESATHYEIPHGIAVTLGVLTATYLSARLEMVSPSYYKEIRRLLQKWHEPYGGILKNVRLGAILEAVKHDKKSIGDSVNCILTRGVGQMERRKVAYETELVPAISDFIDQELSCH